MEDKRQFIDWIKNPKENEVKMVVPKSAWQCRKCGEKNIAKKSSVYELCDTCKRKRDDDDCLGAISGAMCCFM